MKNNRISKAFINTAIGFAAGLMALIAPAMPALADDTVPVIDMGTFENVYEPTDSWIKQDWEYEKKDDYIILKKYTGDDQVVEVPGKVTISGTTYKVKMSCTWIIPSSCAFITFSGKMYLRQMSSETSEAR